MDRLLQDVLGAPGAAAIGRALESRPALASALAPRVALAWAVLALDRGYVGVMPGQPEVRMEVLKHERWTFESPGLSGAGDARPAALAAYLVALSGGVGGSIPRDRAMGRLGRNLDALAKAQFERVNPIKLMRRGRPLAKAKGVEAPGPAAAARPPQGAQPPQPPTPARMGGSVPSAPQPPKPPQPKGATVKAESPRGASLTRAEAEAPCAACDRPQATGGDLHGCPCWSAVLEKAETVRTPLGWVLRSEDAADLAAFIASVRHG